MSNYEFVVRFAERPLNERPIDPQAQKLCHSSALRRIQVSGVGLEMLASMVGSGLSPALRKVIGDALSERMKGQLPLDDEARGDIFTGVYGEVFGPLLTCLEKGGNIEIIRLAQPQGSPGADLLLLDRDSGRLMLQECKGTLADYPTARTTGSLDICGQLRDGRNDGRTQLCWPGPDAMTSSRLRLQVGKGGGFSHHSKSVVCTAIPDARLRALATSCGAAPHTACTGNCVKQCLYSPHAALVCVLSTEEVDPHSHVNGGVQTFLNWYKACERAVWGNAHGSLGTLASNLAASARQMDLPPHGMATATAMVGGLLQFALERGVYIDFTELREAAPLPMRPVVELAHEMQGDVPQPEVREADPRELGEMIWGRSSSSERSDYGRLLGNWRVPIRYPNANAPLRAELCIERSGGELSMRLVPAQLLPAGEAHGRPLEWCLAGIVSGGRMPTELPMEWLYDETVSMRGMGDAAPRVLRLGRALWAPPMAVLSPDVRDRMRRCCRWCDHMADLLGDWRYFYHRSPSDHAESLHGNWPFLPQAFVTTDDRGAMRLPVMV